MGIGPAGHARRVGAPGGQRAERERAKAAKQEAKRQEKAERKKAEEEASAGEQPDAAVVGDAPAAQPAQDGG